MPSGTSFFDRAVFKKTVTRYWPIWAVYLAIWLVALPLNLMIQLQYYTSSWNYWSLLRDNAAAAMPVTLFFALFAAAAVFSHLYNPRSANFFGALPVRREGLFLTHYAAGLSFLIIPNVLTAALTLLIGLLGGVSGILFPTLLWLAIVCGSSFFFYSFAVFCGMFAGHILALPVFYGVLNGLFAALFYMIEVVLEEFCYGFVRIGGWAEELILWLTPVYRLFSVRIVSVYDRVADMGEVSIELVGYDIENSGTLLIYTLAALVLTAAAFLLYRGRRLESAGDVVAVRPMRPVFKYGVSFCSGLFLGYLTAAILGGDIVTRMVCILFWAVIGCFAAEMILDKSFRVFKKWKGALAMAGVFCVLFAVVLFDLTGFETRVPELQDVEYVEITSLYGSYDLGDNVDYGTLKLTTPEEIENFLALHRAAIEQWDLILNGEDWNFLHLQFTYHTKTGSMSRSYTIRIAPSEINKEGSAAWALERIYEDRELYWRAYGFDELEAALSDGGRVARAECYFYGVDESTGLPEDVYEELRDGGIVYFTSRADVLALLEAVETDFRNGALGIRHVGVDGYEYRMRMELIFYWSNTGSSYATDNLTIMVPETAVNTLRVLYELLPGALEDMGLTETVTVQ